MVAPLLGAYPTLRDDQKNTVPDLWNKRGVSAARSNQVPPGSGRVLLPIMLVNVDHERCWLPFRLLTRH